MKYKENCIEKYLGQLNSIDSEISPSGISDSQALKVIALIDMKRQVERNSNWPFDMSTFKRLISASLAPLVIETLLVFYHLMLQI
jgi:hypothetical protein